MIENALREIGLSKNESEIYLALLEHGELSVGETSTKSRVNRRNTYDCLKRLLEKGLVFEVLESRETRYQSVEPEKLRELLQEKQLKLEAAFPMLLELSKTTPKEHNICVYRGIEGWKNYMRDIIRLGQPFYCIGGKGAWMDERLSHFYPQFIKEATRKKIALRHLFDNEVLKSNHEILSQVGKHYKILPPGYSAPASVDFFGDRVYLCSSLHLGGVAKDAVFTVVINEQIATSFRTWFQFMWDFCP